jgi:protein TonB
MIGHQTILAAGLEVARRRLGPSVSRRRRLMLIAIVVSVGVHLAAALLVVVLPRVLPREPAQEEQGAVELLMVEQKGATPSQAGQPENPTPAPAPPEKADTAKTEDQTAEADKGAPANPAKEVPAPPAPAPTTLTSEHGDEPVPAPAKQPASKAADADTQPVDQPDTHPADKANTKPDRKQAEAKPTPQKPAEVQPSPPQKQDAPVFDLAGTDSESNAVVLGGRVIPAMKDDRFRNRPPIYPVEAEMLGEHGTVVLLIHVSEKGLATGADVAESSGVAVLDQAAVTAVRKWRFHPALKEGRPVPFDMPFRFIFEAN